MFTPAVGASYLYILAGFAGMIVFATKFPFSTNLEDLRYDKATFLGMNGFTVWVWSWSLIIAGTIIQLLNYETASV